MDREKAKKTLEEQYPAGTRIELIHMDDPYGLAAGERGIVTGTDDEPALTVSWDCGSSLKLYPEIDSFRIVS